MIFKHLVIISSRDISKRLRLLTNCACPAVQIEKSEYRTRKKDTEFKAEE